MSKLFDSNKILSKLTERAEDIINHSKDNDTIGVISIFKNLCIPFNNENPKRMLFEKIFDMANINYTWDKNIGFIIFSEKKNKKTIVSHMDLIKLFNNGFKKERTHEIKDGYLSGALDNTLTNAILINSILNNRDKNTTYLFTLDEETKQHAIRDYMKKFGNEQFIINLDITNEGYDNNMSIEYDEPCYHICKQINKNIDSPFFTTDRECDDLDEVLKANGYGLSYCIPTKGNIHSYKNYTSIDKLDPYMAGLEFLIHELDLACYTPNIEYLDISKAISYESYDEFKIKDTYKINKSKTIDKKEEYIEVNISKNENIFTKDFNDYLSKSKVDTKRFRNYVYNTIMNNEKFSSAEIILRFHKVDFIALEKKQFLKFIHSGYFKFNKALIINNEEQIKVTDNIMKTLKEMSDEKSDIDKSFDKINYTKKIKKQKFTNKFNEFLSTYEGDAKEFSKYVEDKLFIGDYFSLTEMYSLFRTVDFDNLKRLNIIVSSYDNNIYHFVRKNILTPKIKKKAFDKNKFHKLILELTSYFDRGEIKHMKKFIDKHSETNDFSELEFDKSVQGWLLHSLLDYDLFIQNIDGGYKINYSFEKDNAFKAWDIAQKQKNIDSIWLFTDFMNKRVILYSDFIDYDKKRNIKKIDSIINDLIKNKLIKENKKEENSFKIIQD